MNMDMNMHALASEDAMAVRAGTLLRKTWWSGFLAGFTIAALIAALIVYFTLGGGHMRWPAFFVGLATAVAGMGLYYYLTIGKN